RQQVHQGGTEVLQRVGVDRAARRGSRVGAAARVSVQQLSEQWRRPHAVDQRRDLVRGHRAARTTSAPNVAIVSTRRARVDAGTISTIPSMPSDASSPTWSTKAVDEYSLMPGPATPIGMTLTSSVLSRPDSAR